MMKNIDSFFESMNKTLFLVIMLFTISILGVIDYSIGSELSFSVFYTGPIMLAVWYAGIKQGLIMAVLSALIWMLADIEANITYSSPLIPIWNTLARLSFFLIILYLLRAVKQKLVLEESLADTDTLTGLSNRRYFMEQLENQYNRMLRYPEPLTITYIDLDNFKYINDTFGHDVGDQLLEIVATFLKENSRPMDTSSRLGGDEFAIIYPYMEEQPAKTILNELQQKLLNLMKEKGWPVTFSIGAITYNKRMPPTRDAIKAVDDLMYEVKKSGKNNIHHVSWSD